MNIENIFDTPSLVIWSDPKFSSRQCGKKKYLKKEIEFTVSECSVCCFFIESEKRFLIFDNKKNSWFSKEHNLKDEISTFWKEEHNFCIKN